MTAAVLPDAAAAALTEVFGGRKPVSVTPLGGGMISHAARVDMPSQPVFVKWREDAPPGMFAAEAAGLEALDRATAWALRVPRVIEVGATFLVLDYYAPVAPRDPEGFTARFAEGLAALHRMTSRRGVGGLRARPYGFDSDGYLGVMPQPNRPALRKWPDFYRECRLLPQIEHARVKGLLTPEREGLLMRVVERLGVLLDGLPREVSLLHGDLWSGNFLCAKDDEPVLFDPAAYYGHREMEIAYVELFGGFPEGFVEIYQEVLPLDEGYPRRRALHQLYHLLNHWNHFGEPYGARCEQVCRHYLSS